MIAGTRAVMKVFTALIVSVALALSVATFANAAVLKPPPFTPTPTAEDTVITYSGTATKTNERGEVTNSEQKFGADCSSGVCLLFIDKGERVPPDVKIIDGHGSFELAPGDVPCDKFPYPETVTADFEGQTATLTQNGLGTDWMNCPDRGRLRYITFTTVTVGILVSGNPCFITDTCPTPEPKPEPTVEAIVATVLPVALSRNIDEPSVLSALPTADTAFTVRNALWATAMAIILALLVAFPKHLLSSAASTASKRLAKWGEKLADAAGTPWKRLRTFVSRITSIKGWGAATIGIAVAAIISSFVDPEFGWNAASFRTFISILVSLALQITSGWLLLIWLVRRTHPTAKAEFEFRPLTLLIVVGAVILSRLTEFAPGIIFGLVAGLSFGALLATAERARVALIGLGRAFVLSLLAWAGYSLMAPIIDGGPVIVFITETLSALTIAGIVALPIALIPFRGTTGQMLWDWNRWIWIGSYVVGLFGFFLILMPMPFSWKTVPVSLATWIGMFVAYAVGSVILWAIIVRPWEKEKDAEKPTVNPVVHEPVPEEAG